MGWSEGGQYALAATFELAERVTGCAVIAGCPPLDDRATLAQSNHLDRVLATLSRRAPVALRIMAGGTRALAHHVRVRSAHRPPGTNPGRGGGGQGARRVVPLHPR